MSIRVAILAILVGVISVVAEYTQPSIWPQVSPPDLVAINHSSLTFLQRKIFISSAQVLRNWPEPDKRSPFPVRVEKWQCEDFV